MKRSFLRSIRASSSMWGCPLTCDFMPLSANSWQNVSPDLHSYSESLTSSRVLPRHETLPMPVTTTRGYLASIDTRAERATRWAEARSDEKVSPSHGSKYSRAINECKRHTIGDGDEA